MNSILSNWKTSLVGVVAGALILLGQSYQPGQTAKQWGMAIANAVAAAGVGLLAKDHNATS